MRDIIDIKYFIIFFDLYIYEISNKNHCDKREKGEKEAFPSFVKVRYDNKISIVIYDITHK